jgi:hypothetical protein
MFKINNLFLAGVAITWAVVFIITAILFIIHGLNILISLNWLLGTIVSVFVVSLAVGLIIYIIDKFD